MTRLAPLRIRIPAIGVAAGVTALGLNRDRTIKVPRNPDLAGWYRLGPVPGQVGSAVIIGHVDSKTGPAVFYRLKHLRAGAIVTVRLPDGVAARFKVTRVATYPNAKFPALRVYGSYGKPLLNLVTCGGRYDRRAGGYTANVVVYTALVSLKRAGRPVQ